MLEIPDVVRSKAVVAGQRGWLDGLPGLVAELADRWHLEVGPTMPGGTEALVLAVERPDGPAVLKLLVPRDGQNAADEITVLRLADGQGCVRLLDADAGRSALLLERLGPSMADLGLPLRRRLAELCDAARRVWRPAPGADLPDGAQKGRWLAEFITATWERLGRPCSERVVDHALACAARRTDAHDDERAVLVHGDVHRWNALRADGAFRLIDPDGLRAEPEYDLGILMREDPSELVAADPWDRAHWLARRSGRDATAIWEWGVVERVSTGLVCTELGLRTAGDEMLAAAEQIARSS